MSASEETIQSDADLLPEFTPSSSDASGEPSLQGLNLGDNGGEQSEQSRERAIEVGERFSEDFVVQEKYRILGEGLTSIVFEAEKKVDKKKYAIKKIQQSKFIGEKQLKEVESLAELDHVGIVRYYTAWIEKSRKDLYIQLELCRSTLSQWLHDHVNREKETILNHFREIVTAVEYIHSKNKIHRDLKPSNIFFDERDKLKIGDFGLVTTHDVSEDSAGEAGAAADHSAMKGTPDYMSPEQHARDPYDEKVDIYSLGLIFIEMCAVTNTGNKKQVFENARNGIYPQQKLFAGNSFKHFLGLMLTKNPRKRSSASDILKHDIFSKPKPSTDSITVKNKKMNVNINSITGGNVMIGNGNVMNVGNNTMTSKIKKKPTKPITNSQEKPSIDDLLNIKGNVGSHWKDLGCNLGFQDSELDQLQLEYSNDFSEINYQILLRWTQRDPNATKSQLANVFMNLERGDLADILSD